MVDCAEETIRKGVHQQGEQAIDRACCTRQISQLIHKRRREHGHETGCDDKERRGGVEELGDARNDAAGLFTKHPQCRRPFPVGVREVGGHVSIWRRSDAALSGWSNEQRPGKGYKDRPHYAADGCALSLSRRLA